MAVGKICGVGVGESRGFGENSPGECGGRAERCAPHVDVAWQRGRDSIGDKGFVPQPRLGMFRPLPALPLAHHIKAISHSVVVDGAEYSVSRVGTTQCNRDGTGTSACGLAALNFARIAFSIEQSANGLRDTTLLQAVLARACAEV